MRTVALCVLALCLVMATAHAALVVQDVVQDPVTAVVSNVVGSDAAEVVAGSLDFIDRNATLTFTDRSAALAFVNR
jgi:opacity protein-like surface antigen